MEGSLATSLVLAREIVSSSEWATALVSAMDLRVIRKGEGQEMINNRKTSETLEWRGGS